MGPRTSLVALAVLAALLVAPLVAMPAQPPSIPAPASAAPILPASAGTVQPLAASLSFALTASAAQADPKDVVVFTVYFNNTGTQAAPMAWINVTAASGFTFLGDTAAGNLSGYPDYRFGSLALGLHAFTLRLQVNVGTSPGTRLAVSATLVYSDGSSGQQFLGPATASVLVGVVTKQLYLAPGPLATTILTPVPPTGTLSPQGTYTLNAGGPAVGFDLTPHLARSFRVLNATAVLYLAPSPPPASVAVNLTLVDVNGGATTSVASAGRTYGVTGSGYWTLYYTFPAMDYVFAAGHQIRLQVLNAASTAVPVLLATNATAEPSDVNLQTTSYVSVDSVQPARSPTTYLSSKSSLVVTANVSDPFGSAEIIAAHVNVTGPTGSLHGWGDAFPAVATDPSNPSRWKLFQVSLYPLPANGTYSVEVTAVERNGVTDIADGGAVVRAPGFTFQKTASPVQGKTGTKITYFLWYNNTGSGPAARVWINDTLPSQVNFQNASLAPTTSSGNNYAWVLTSVGVGPHVLQIFVQVRGGISGVSYIRNWASLNDSDPQGFLWPAMRSHADVVLNGPYLTLTQTSTPAASVHANQTVVFAIHIANTGDAAAALWVNDTLPGGLAYVSDTATAVGASRTVAGNVVRWSFPGMPSGSLSPSYLNFTMTARAAPGVAWGTSLPNVIGVNDTSQNGLLMPDQVYVLRLTVASPSVASAAASFGVTSAVPHVALPLTVNFTNAGNEASGTVWINLTLDAALQFVSSPASVSVAGPVVRLTLPSAALGPDSVPLTLSALPSVTDGQVLSVAGTLRAADGYGNLLPMIAVTAGSVPVALPNVSFRLSPEVVTVEAGQTIAYTITGGNTGSGTASALWVNVSLPSSLEYVSDTFGVAPARLGSVLAWEWTGYAPGAHTYSLTLAADGGAPDRSSTPISFSVQAVDAGGNYRPGAAFGGVVDFLAPHISVSVWASQNDTLPGQSYTYTLVVENNGSTTAATLWLTDAFDSRLVVVSYSSSVSAHGTSELNWTFSNLAPGQRISFTVTVSVPQGTPANAEISNTVAAEYTNSIGTVLGSVRSAPATIRVVPDLSGVLWILGGGVAIGLPVIFAVYRRYRVRVEDVFLVYRDGILVSHLSQGERLDKDEDQLSGMLTAVQDFVKDAFTYGEHRELHQLEFGDYHVLIERGKLVYLAVVYQGRDSGLIRKKVRTVLDEVEAKYGGVFDAWDGDMATVAGTRDLLREGFVEAKHPWSLVQSKSG